MIRYSLIISAELNAIVRKMADEQGVSLSTLIRTSLAMLSVCHKAKADGQRVGLVDDPKKLDTLFVW